ncbi:MAG: FAD:protein FMN transferase [Eubacterium sp.]|jgi:thiamine biosynthesis lipoprotein|nr:FAD:protein FMN transferase [Eubacterium sp.]MCH4047107.1 FAD:protein FMN transferase [Eubacterium sp.]MCH4080204.1 FAD:protein FMN transferase [Eubacterium sp.]MCH4111195.1 FAD:protein FMN transferase [Eubacterium sp.]MCI1306835.1 FAD:protein FMN transferase [Eubacterium sp.]
MKKLITVILTIVMTACIIIPQTACAPQKSKSDSVPSHTKESYYFDTICKITIYSMSKNKADDIIAKAFKRCSQYENILSKTKKGSDIWKINHAGGKPVQVHAITAQIIHDGMKYGDETNGLFDITIGKAEDLYNWHAEKHKLPTDAQLKHAVKYVGYKQIHVNGNTVTMGTTEGEIDLGGIAKGWIADHIGDYLQELGVKSAIISLGGNIVCVGDKKGQPFQIGIEKPFSEMSEIVGSTTARNKTIVTSGIYERYFRKNGKLYHHILEPATGRPADTDISGVTIMAEDGHSVDCDAMATTCLLLGRKKALKFIERKKGYECLIITRSGRIYKTSGFKFKKES